MNMDAGAAFFEKLEDGRIRCGICPHNCAIGLGESGTCLTRYGDGNGIRVSTYGMLRAAAFDPVEKKPLFHYRPGSKTFSIASVGCNLICPFCQNHSLSQALRLNDSIALEGRKWSPADVVDAATRSDSVSISFTYSEPILQFEFARDVAELARPQDVELIFVTNGQANAKPAEEIAGFITAANVDLKSFVAANYKNVLGGSLRASTRTIEIFARAGVWVEVTTLVIPGFNDSDDELKEIARFIKGIGSTVPWHVSRFHPDYQWLDRDPTSIDTLKRAREIGMSEGLSYVYVGNLPGDEGEKTHCPSCGAVVVDRRGYRIIDKAVEDGQCKACGEPIEGVGLL
ncbi:MAG: AmmeMemoRadiSam system radical SAM enzyme [Proteobacteria bacterium]|nr:AmmeMemoRadiSam system radical SAM enzyme [Pseudomonadota bacterium]